MKGFLLSFLINLIFNAEFLVLAVIALLLHIFLKFPVVIVYVLLGLWVLLALLITLGLGVLSRGTPPPPYQKNVNPYSKKTSEYLKKNHDDNNGSDKEP